MKVKGVIRLRVELEPEFVAAFEARHGTHRVKDISESILALIEQYKAGMIAAQSGVYVNGAATLQPYPITAGSISTTSLTLKPPAKWEEVESGK